MSSSSPLSLFSTPTPPMMSDVLLVGDGSTVWVGVTLLPSDDDFGGELWSLVGDAAGAVPFVADSTMILLFDRWAVLG